MEISAMALSNQYPSLKNKVVFISGGATGIGAALVEAFCQQGAQVAFVDILAAEAEQLVRKIGEIPGATKPHFFHCDLTRTADLQNALKSVDAQLGPVTVLLNNAASDTRHDFRTVDEDYWNSRINVNLRHAFFAIQAVYPGMKAAGGGSIVNFGSMSWYECQGGMTGYTTAKAALEGMTRGLARDLGQDNIRINTLIPGWVMTERQLRDWVNEDTLKDIQRSQCLKNPLMPDDISAMALFLASDDSKMCTAQNFIVDGGWI
jgi:NAD(P)-dependent dehydrogenase (short-subunit alcohol dehydrogenase family)